ncbi:MAG TPA: MFS transporter [Nocardioidaceae bacterium]|nr:MFS transporter [Nocardioidaceae bacterium]
MTECLPATTPVDRILTPPLVRLLVAVFGGAVGFYLLLSVVPLYAASTGSGNAGAGLATGALMLATVLTELTVPTLLARYGYRTVIALGLILLGAPSAVLAMTSDLTVILIVCLARGAGLAIIVVGATALVAKLVPARRRAEGLAVYGVAFGAPGVVGLPLGVSLTSWVGFEPVFVAATVLTLASLVAAPGLPRRRDHPEAPVPIMRGLSTSGLLPPALVFTAITIATGVLVTFLPLAVSSDRREWVSVALMVQAVAVLVARWVAGRLGDRWGSGRLLPTAVVLAASGIAALIAVDNMGAVIVGMLLFGLGFGAAQNVTLAMMYDRVSENEYARVSAVWNLAYDGGMGIGAVGFGAIVGGTGYPAAFAIVAGLLAVALVPAWRDRRR